MTKVPMRRFASRLALFAAVLCGGAPAFVQAQSAVATKNFTVIGSVPAQCTGGTVTGGSSTFDLGVLTDTTTGLLRTDLSAPDRVISGSFCTSRSTISVVASPIAAQTFTATAPAGFARTVDYTATATGWTTTPASFGTAAATNPAATQTRDTAFTGDITVGIGSFATTGGSNLRLVADTNYSGTVTVTLTATN
jgi:hypothetical protein